MGRMVDVREIKRRMQLEGATKTIAHISEALEKGHLKPDDFSVRDLAAGLVKGGEEWVRLMSSPKGGFRNISEAASAVDTSAFSNITGQIVYSKILEKYNLPKFIGSELCSDTKTVFLDGEKVAGIGQIGDEAEKVGEAQPYPTAGVTEEYVVTPPTEKRGMIVPVTREIIIADRTGVLLERAGAVGEWLGLQKEKRVLDACFGITNTYNRNGVQTNTYLTSGAYVNSHSNPLVDYTDLSNAEILLNAITDPNTGEPYMHDPNTIVVPYDLKQTAERILAATQVAHVDNQTNAATVRMYSDVPSSIFGSKYKVVTSPYVKARTSSGSTWFLGDFKKAFSYMQVWDITTSQQGETSAVAFTHDIVMQFKADERGVPAVMNPRYVTKNT
jgi:hypothetical protein